MNLTLSSSDANNGSRQRFELELLLQRAVPNPDQLNRSKDLLKDAVDGISPDGWKHLQSVPINSDSDHLDIAIPSHWRDEDWQRLIEQLPTQNRITQHITNPSESSARYGSKHACDWRRNRRNGQNAEQSCRLL
jgi:hypothetical protein